MLAESIGISKDAVGAEYATGRDYDFDDED